MQDAKLKASDIDEVVLVGGSTRMPMVQELVRKLTAARSRTGASTRTRWWRSARRCRAACCAGEVKDVLLLDVTPLTLGVETLGGVMTPLIERNTTIPVRKSEVFSTAEDSQTAVTIHVLQGERPMAADNMTLGQFNLEGIPPAPARHAAGRGDVRHRRQRHPERDAPRTRPPARSRRSRSPPRPT